MALSLGTTKPARDGSFVAAPSFDLETFAANFGGVTILKLKPGAVLFRQGEPADALFYLQEGHVQTTVVSRHGKEGILGIVEPGSFCGEGALLGNRFRVGTAVCLGSSVVARVERANVIRAIRQDPAIAEFFIAFALTSVVRLREKLVSQLFDSSEIRLARHLLILANCDNGRREHVIRNVDQEALAQMIGTTRSRVNYFMNKFRRLGYIDYNGNIVVHGTRLNEALREPSFPPRAARKPTAA
jgi:CRP/FNR family cyclic AMP-dependent transcriptional regulator